MTRRPIPTPARRAKLGLLALPSTIAGGVERHLYRARGAVCRTGAFRARGGAGPQGRTVVRTANVPTVAAYAAKMQTEAARAAYRRRASVAEFSNLGLKAKLGLRQFCVRGLAQVRCEVLWACLTYNLQVADPNSQNASPSNPAKPKPILSQLQRPGSEPVILSPYFGRRTLVVCSSPCAAINC